MSEEEKVAAVDDNMDNVDVDDVANLDDNIFDQKNELIDDSSEKSFQCTHPQNKGGHIVYKCQGSDAQGMWEGDRRYNEFHKLHEKLDQRWPGIPLPMLPPKKAIGNKDIKFINERRFYLERFLKKMSAFEYILNSQEFTIFSRPNGDIEKMLGAVPKSSSGDIVEKYREVLGIQEHMVDPIEKDKLDQQCLEFSHFAKQIIPVLKGMIKSIASYMSNKSQSNTDYKIFLQMLDKYEELNLANYVEGDESKMIFGNSQFKETENVNDLVMNMTDNLKNPYFNLYHWCKGELFDIIAVHKALQQKEKMQEKIGKTEKKKRST